MKFTTSIAALATVAIAEDVVTYADPRIEINWLSSVNSPSSNRPDILEGYQIQHWRNRYILPYMEYWAWSLNARWNFWVYGETTVAPCVEQLGSFESFDEFKTYLVELGDDYPKDLTAHGMDHAGFDAATYIMTHSTDDEYVIRYVVWENAMVEPVQISPIPEEITLEDICHPGNNGHVSIQQFADSFSTQNHRLFVLPYESLPMATEWKTWLTSNTPDIMMNVEAMPVVHDPTDYSGYTGTTYGKTITNAMWLFLARGQVKP